MKRAMLSAQVKSITIQCNKIVINRRNMKASSYSPVDYIINHDFFSYYYGPGYLVIFIHINEREGETNKDTMLQVNKKSTLRSLPSIVHVLFMFIHYLATHMLLYEIHFSGMNKSHTHYLKYLSILFFAIFETFMTYYVRYLFCNWCQYNSNIIHFLMSF